MGPLHHFEDAVVHPSLTDVYICSLCGNPGINNTSSPNHETSKSITRAMTINIPMEDKQDDGVDWTEARGRHLLTWY